MKQTGRRISGGFSLIELSIVLVVVGLLAAVGIESLTMVSESNKVAETKKKLDEIELTLASHLRLYGALPCPASPALAESDANFGKSQAACDAVAVGATDVDGAIDEEDIRIGIIPIVDIGLPKDYAFDGWGNTFTYAVIKDLAVDDTAYDAYDDATGGAPNSGTDGIIRVQDRTGNQLSLAHLKSIIPYVLVSHGKDSKGGYNSSGNLAASCAGGGASGAFYNAITADALDDDIENCDNADTLFIADNPYDIDGIEDYYDDYVRYKTKNKLEADAEKTTVSGGGAANAAGDANEVQYNNGSDAFAASSELKFSGASGLIGNDSGGTAVDFRWETDTLGYGLFADASANQFFYGADASTTYAGARHHFLGNLVFSELSADLSDANGDKVLLSFTLDPTIQIIDTATTFSSLNQYQLDFDMGPTNKEATYAYNQMLFEDSNVVKTNISSSYINFDSTIGSGGYGIRDNSGVLEQKDSGGSWKPMNNGIIGTKVQTSAPGAQTLTDSYVDVTGSSLSYTPKSATSKLLVTYSFHAATTASGTIGLHWRLYSGATASTLSERGTHLVNPYGEARIEITDVIDSWGTSSGSIKLQARRYSASYAGYLHRTYWYDGAADNASSDITVTIMEIEN